MIVLITALATFAVATLAIILFTVSDRFAVSFSLAVIVVILFSLSGWPTGPAILLGGVPVFAITYLAQKEWHR